MNKKIFFLSLLFIFISFPASRALHAATITQFTVSPASATFADQDPDLGQVTSSPAITATIRITGLAGGQIWTLQIRADTDLLNGGVSIPATNIRWTATGGGFPAPTCTNGTLAYSNQQAAQGNGFFGFAFPTVTFNFLLQNSWGYQPGNYSGTVTLTLTAPGAAAQTRTITLSTNIAARASLIFGSAAISFSSENPDSMPSIPANVNPMSVTSSARTGAAQTANLTCLASGDLTSGTDTIAVGNITWTATGTGYMSGAMNRITAQTAGTWTGSGQRTGTFSYFFANSWSYIVGNYSTSINYTLTAP